MRVLVVVLLVGIAGCGDGSSPPAQTADADPFAALAKIGAEIKRDDQGEVVEVNLALTKITDADLVHLKGLTKLQTLGLAHTKVTDGGLVHLKGLAKLQTLNLMRTKITDAGLVHLKGLTGLQTLGLPSQITDAGLVHLKGMTNLTYLNLAMTKITDAGIADLKKSLPNCNIDPPPSSDHAITGVTPRARGGGVVRIWRLPPLSSLDDGQDRPAGVRR